MDAESSKRVVDNEKKKMEDELDNLSKELKVKFIGGEILTSEEQILDSSFFERRCSARLFVRRD